MVLEREKEAMNKEGKMEEQKDPKAWVRQWIGLMMAGTLIVCGLTQVLAPVVCGVSVEIPLWLLILAGGCVTWFFGSREIEKWKAK